MEIPNIPSLYLGSDGIEPVRCREHGQEFKQVCKTHMTELCITCRRIEHKRCKTVIDIRDASENINCKLHGRKNTESVKNLSEHFTELKAAGEDIKAQLPIKTNSAIDKVKQKRKDIDAYHLDEIEAKAVAEIRRKMEEYRKSVEEMIRLCEFSLSSLSTIIFDIERTMSGGNAEKFIAINKASIQTDKYCNTEVKRDEVGDKVPLATSFNVLQDGRKLVLDKNNNTIQLYDMHNTCVTETVQPVKIGEACISVVLNSNTEALVSTQKLRVFNVIIGDELAVREINTNYDIYAMTKYGEDQLYVILHNGQVQICILDKNMENIIKDILNDGGRLFKVPGFLGFSADKDTIYVLDCWKGCYGKH